MITQKLNRHVHFIGIALSLYPASYPIYLNATRQNEHMNGTAMAQRHISHFLLIVFPVFSTFLLLPNELKESNGMFPHGESCWRKRFATNS